jgi:LAS superfamily LD-carboxypeptidase LdcB
MKQFLLFLNKANKNKGNLSMASRSLAPPGYSFHGIGDFDVGKKGYGIHNFTERFTKTNVYKRLTDLGYIKFRYERDNDLGVRFEPWHIEVI